MLLMKALRQRPQTIIRHAKGAFSPAEVTDPILYWGPQPPITTAVARPNDRIRYYATIPTSLWAGRQCISAKRANRKSRNTATRLEFRSSSG